MVYEIKKSFLLSDDSLVANLQKDGIVFKSTELSTFYTQITPKTSVKFQRCGDEFFKIISQKSEVLKKTQIQIPKKDFLKARKKALTPTLKQKRLEFKFCSLKSYIELYEKPILCVLTVCFQTLDEAKKFAIPKNFKPLKELNLNAKDLLLYGFSTEDFDIEKCFKIIEKNQNFTLEFPDAINAFDGLRIFLFYLFRRLKFYWNLVLQEKKHEDLFELYLYAEKIFVIISSFNEVFDKNLNDLLASKFQGLAQNIYAFLEQKEAQNDLLLFLSSKELNALFNDFEIFIKESSFYRGLQRDMFFKQLSALELRKKLVLFKFFLVKKFDLDEFFPKFRELCVFLEYFKTLFNLKSLDKLSKNYFLNSQEKSFSKIMKKKKKLLKLISKTSKSLRIYKG